MPQPSPTLWGAAQQPSQSAQFAIGTPEVTHSFLRPESISSPGISPANCQNALAERLDNAREISVARERLAFQQRVHEDAVKDFHDEIDQLERQVAALKSSTAAASPHSSRYIQRLEAEAARSGSNGRRTSALTAHWKRPNRRWKARSPSFVSRSTHSSAESSDSATSGIVNATSSRLDCGEQKLPETSFVTRSIA
ncbi:unnamed protein product [Phytophthora fragariaefolia]|uniref:Unnamed protein product n=1 Tax=Phytophthora fragariaefolia TaxID=1490495 RepID=A0A9W6Y3W4_9STRA|nr:unnamed protein product [Phytophthora fragariaefolia]